VGFSVSNSSIYAGGGASDVAVGRVLSRAWTVFTNNFVIFFITTLVVSLPNLLIETASTPSAAANPSAVLWKVGIAFPLALILNTIGEAVIVYGAFQDLRGHPVRLNDALMKGLARFFPIIGLAIVSSIGIAVGMLLLIVPGIILAIMWSVALPVCVLEQLGPISSLGRSSDLTKGHRWKILGVIILLVIGNVLGAFLLGLLLAPVGFMVTVIGSLVWTALWTAYYNSVLVMIYHDLRVSKEGVDVEQIAAVFD
jgi:hypothetical protein